MLREPTLALSATIALCATTQAQAGLEEDFLAATNEWLEDYALCWDERDANYGVLPVVIDWYKINTVSSSIIRGLERQGFVTTEELRSPRGQDLAKVSYTPEGKETLEWTKQGFCVAYPRAEEITSYEMHEYEGVELAKIRYTSVLTDFPDWFDPSFYDGLAGLDGPLDTPGWLMKAADGWYRSPTLPKPPAE